MPDAQAASVTIIVTMGGTVQSTTATPGAPPAIPADEAMSLLKRVHACPHRKAEGCGCNGALCRAGRGDFDGGKTASVQRCLACKRDEASTAPDPP